MLGAIIGALRRHLIRKQQLEGERATALEGAGRSDVAWADRLALLREGAAQFEELQRPPAPPRRLPERLDDVVAACVSRS